jgi:hypothetical protein
LLDDGPEFRFMNPGASIQASGNPDVQQARSVSAALGSPGNPRATCEFSAAATRIRVIEFHPFE